MNKIGIYYISTGNYKNYFPKYLSSINNFFPQFEKDLLILSDGLKEYDGKEINNCNIKVIHIEDFPWPLNTLLKTQYFSKYKLENEIICYFNGNAVFYEKGNKYYENLLKKIEDNKFICSKHTAKGDEYSNFECLSLLEDNPRSISYIGNKNYMYVQGGFLISKNVMFYQYCNEVNEMLSVDLRNKVMPRWDDETYFNKWVYIHDYIKHDISFCKKHFMSYDSYTNNEINKTDDCLLNLANGKFKKEK